MAVVALVGTPVAGQGIEEEPKRTEAEQAAADAALAETLELAPEQPPAADDPFAAVVAADERVAEAALERLDVTAESDAANLRALAAAQDLQAAQEKERAAVMVREAAIDELSIERERLSDLSVRAYVTGGSMDIERYQALAEGDTTDPQVGREIMFGQVLARQADITEGAQRDLKVARRKLARRSRGGGGRRCRSGSPPRHLSRLTSDRAEAEAAHARALAEAADADAALRSAGARPITLVPEAVAIIGMPRLSASDLAGWYEAGPYRPRVATPIEDYARWFIEEGRAEGIRGDIAFAQAVLETGGFANQDTVEANNFSGIGHCDTCASGWRFPSPRLGVRAQIQLLKSYAVKKPSYVNELVDRRLRGPAGCCDTWGDLTTVWATDPTYGPKVMLLYTSIVDHALDRRGRGEGFDEPEPAPAR